jgi:hypothetical protein
LRVGFCCLAKEAGCADGVFLFMHCVVCQGLLGCDLLFLFIFLFFLALGAYSDTCSGQ